ncbi:unnamed protein product, partial [Rotaria sp. Silwood1]
MNPEVNHAKGGKLRREKFENELELDNVDHNKIR